MLPTFQGIYRKGRVEFIESPPSVEGEARVIVTFLESGTIDLESREINAKQAAELRARLMPFAEDWMSPEMDAYDHYDQAKSNLPTR